LHQKQRDGSENHDAHDHVRKTSRFHLREHNTEYKSSENLKIRRYVQHVIFVFIQVRPVSSFQLPKMAVTRFLLLLQKQLQIFKLFAHPFLLLLRSFCVSKYIYLFISLSLFRLARCRQVSRLFSSRDCSSVVLRLLRFILCEEDGLTDTEGKKFLCVFSSFALYVCVSKSRLLLLLCCV